MEKSISNSLATEANIQRNSPEALATETTGAKLPASSSNIQRASEQIGQVGSAVARQHIFRNYVASNQNSNSSAISLQRKISQTQTVALVPTPRPTVEPPNWIVEQAAGFARAAGVIFEGFVEGAVNVTKVLASFVVDGLVFEIVVVSSGAIAIVLGTASPVANDSPPRQATTSKKKGSSSEKQKQDQTPQNGSRPQAGSGNQTETQTDNNNREHRGRLQVQGDDMKNFENGEISFPWTQKTPMTKAIASAELANLKRQLSKSQLANRTEAFKKAEKFIDSTVYNAPPQATRTFQNNNLKDKTLRVDIEIRTGTAFV